MNLLTCPACGCRVQAADALLGRRIRCFGCGQPFIATADSSPPPSPRREALPLRPSEGPRAGEDERAETERGPFCPGCGRRISWADLRCPFCGEELEPENAAAPGRGGEPFRRDYEPHRGPLIATLGNLSMLIGGLSLCLFGLGALFSIPLGILAWVMAQRDLERMRDGCMDPRGRGQTETGRTGGMAGILLGLIFAAFFALVYLAR